VARLGATGGLRRWRLDALIVRSVPSVRKAVKWNSPFCGIESQGWFLSYHCFTKYVKVTFFPRHVAAPTSPGESKHKEVRYLDIHEDDQLDESSVRRLGEASQRIARRTNVSGQCARWGPLSGHLSLLLKNPCDTEQMS
jgi:hypothetical protein